MQFSEDRSVFVVPCVMHSPRISTELNLTTIFVLVTTQFQRPLVEMI
jgi:hypothetical protein